MAGRRGRLVFIIGLIVAAVALVIGITLRREAGAPRASETSVAAAEAPGPAIRMHLAEGRAVVIAPTATCRTSADPKAAVALRLGRGDMLSAAERRGGWTRFKEGAFDCWLPDRLLQFD